MYVTHVKRMFLAALFIVSFVGCGKNGPEIVSVSGTLTRNGKPVPFMEVYFIPTQGRNSVGMTDDQGRFTLGYLAGVEGAQVGTHKVFVTYNPPAETGFPPPADLAQITAKYGSTEVSQISVDLKEDVDDLEIKLD